MDPQVEADRLKQIKFLEKARGCLPGDRSEPYIDFNPEALYALVATYESIAVLFSFSPRERTSFIKDADKDNTHLHVNFIISYIIKQPTDSSEQFAKSRCVSEIIQSLYAQGKLRSLCS